jgi:hypothetical protein
LSNCETTGGLCVTFSCWQCDWFFFRHYSFPP